MCKAPSEINFCHSSIIFRRRKLILHAAKKLSPRRTFYYIFGNKQKIRLSNKIFFSSRGFSRIFADLILFRPAFLCADSRLIAFQPYLVFTAVFSKNQRRYWQEIRCRFRMADETYFSSNTLSKGVLPFSSKVWKEFVFECSN